MPEPTPVPPADAEIVTADRSSSWNTDDWWANWLGLFILGTLLLATWAFTPKDLAEKVAAHEAAKAELARLVADDPDNAEARKAAKEQAAKTQSALAVNPLKSYFAAPNSWKESPAEAFIGKKGEPLMQPFLRVFLVSLALFGVGVWNLRRGAPQFPLAFAVVFFLALTAFIIAGQAVINELGLEFALWALVLGLIISNTVGTPKFLTPALQTEFYIKTGLVLLGAEVLFHQLVALGKPGIFISWVTTPIVLIATYIFGQKVLKMQSKSLNMVICADMSVCGVSAAIATGAACRAKKEELSVAISLSLAFTVIMMIVMPRVIQAVGMDPVLGGAWIGGTIDSTGAVVAAGEALGEAGRLTAITIKSIQNVLIGVIAFFVAVYWVTCVDRHATGNQPGVGEIWRRFPKFVLGFLAASLVFSWITASSPVGEATTSAVISSTKVLRGWFFCLAFVSIGLESNFRELAKQMAGGKPLILYVCGQTLNLVLTLFMAWLMFEKVFPDAAATLQR